jgi:hypothetical protein
MVAVDRGPVSGSKKGREVKHMHGGVSLMDAAFPKSRFGQIRRVLLKVSAQVERAAKLRYPLRQPVQSAKPRVCQLYRVD